MLTAVSLASAIARPGSRTHRAPFHTIHSRRSVTYFTLSPCRRANRLALAVSVMPQEFRQSRLFFLRRIMAVAGIVQARLHPGDERRPIPALTAVALTRGSRLASGGQVMTPS